MRLKDRLFMHPVAKYSKYGQFPWKMTVHLFLAIFTSAQIILIVNRSSLYSLSQMTLWNKLFLSREASGDDASLTYERRLFSQETLLSFVNETVSTYYYINAYTFDNYNYRMKDGALSPITMQIEYLASEPKPGESFKSFYDLNLTYFGPLQPCPRTFLKKAKFFQLKFYILHVLPADDHLASTCYEWELTQNYDFAMRGPVTVTLDAVTSACDLSDRKG